MNTRKSRAEFINFRIRLDSGCSSTIVMRRPIAKINPKEYDMMKWHTQAGNITTNIKVEIDFTLPELSLKKIMALYCRVDDSVKGRCDIILGRYI